MSFTMNGIGPHASPIRATRLVLWWSRFLRRDERLAYPVLLLLGVTDAAGYSMIGPVLPVLQRATGASVTTVNMLAACFPLAMLGGFAAAGRLAHAGRIRAALVGGLGCLIAGSIAFTY
jgi:cyanate permease